MQTRSLAPTYPPSWRCASHRIPRSVRASATVPASARPCSKSLLLLFENAAVGYVVDGNLSLRPETSNSYNLGIESSPRPWLTLSGNFYRNDLRNLIQPLLVQSASSTGPQRFSYGNIAAAYTQGVELSLKLRKSGQPWPRASATR